MPFATLYRSLLTVALKQTKVINEQDLALVSDYEIIPVCLLTMIIHQKKMYTSYKK